MSLESFQKNVPIRDYEGLKEYIEEQLEVKKMFFGLASQNIFVRRAEPQVELSIYLLLKRATNHLNSARNALLAKLLALATQSLLAVR